MNIKCIDVQTDSLAAINSLSCNNNNWELNDRETRAKDYKSPKVKKTLVNDLPELPIRQMSFRSSLKFCTYLWL